MKRLIGGLVGGGMAIFAGASAMDDDTKRDETGSIVESGGLGVLAIQLGDCIQLPGDMTTEAIEIVSVEGVPCEQAHDGQVYAELELPGDGPFPGQTAVEEQARFSCMAEWPVGVGTVYEDDVARDFTTFHPVAEGWAVGDRGVQCILTNADGSPMVGDQLG
jgi:hypothetical protein